MKLLRVGTRTAGAVVLLRHGERHLLLGVAPGRVATLVGTYLSGVRSMSQIASILLVAWAWQLLFPPMVSLGQT